MVGECFYKGMKTKYKIKQSWLWDKDISDFVKTKISGYSLNICSGMCDIGDIKIDLDPQNNSIIKGDMKNLPFKDNTFDTVIEDPPWKIGYFDRWQPFFECVRVCKIGGIIIYNAYWIPQSEYAELKELYIRQDNAFTNTSIISIFEKIKDINIFRRIDGKI